MKMFTVANAITSFWSNHDLLYSLVKRELQSKYKGTFLGVVWVFAHPLLMLVIYSFVFGVIFSSRWRGQSSMWDFVEMLYCGLIVYALFSEVVSKSPGLIVNNQNYVKKVVFPLELLPFSNLLTSLFNSVVSISILMALVFFDKMSIHWTCLYMPLVLMPVIFYALGFAWLLSALGVFFRDIEQFIGVLMSMLLFLSPIFYASAAAPEFAQQLMVFNPLTFSIEEMRNVVLLGNNLNWFNWLISSSTSILVAFIGLWLFQKFRPAFADVI